MLPIDGADLCINVGHQSVALGVGSRSPKTAQTRRTIILCWIATVKLRPKSLLSAESSRLGTSVDFIVADPVGLPLQTASTRATCGELIDVALQSCLSVQGTTRSVHLMSKVVEF